MFVSILVDIQQVALINFQSVLHPQCAFVLQNPKSLVLILNAHLVIFFGNYAPPPLFKKISSLLTLFYSYLALLFCRHTHTNKHTDSYVH